MKTAETMCPVSTRAFITHACLGHRGSARLSCRHVIGDQVLPGCSWADNTGWGQRRRSGRVKTAQSDGRNGVAMSRSTTKQFRAPFANAGSPAGGRDEDIFYIIGSISGSLIWLPDTTATGESALGSSTCREREASSDRFRRRNCNPAPRKPARSSRTKRAKPGPTGGAAPPREAGVAASSNASATPNTTALQPQRHGHNS